jgi:hypothetical protein
MVAKAALLTLVGVGGVGFGVQAAKSARAGSATSAMVLFFKEGSIRTFSARPTKEWLADKRIETMC